MVKTKAFTLVKHIRQQLANTYPEEAEAMAFEIVQHFSGLDRTQIILNTLFTTGPRFEKQVANYIHRLQHHEPLQYVLGSVYFYNRRFKVTPATLIPRPETEELVQWIIEDQQNTKNAQLLDVGTGSGCIATTLALELPNHHVLGTDISKEALAVARKNATALEAHVQWRQANVFEPWPITNYHVIVSNPPYVLNSEKETMQLNVLQYEPGMALFVPDTNPLLFYKRIAQQATLHLHPNGALYFEINEKFGQDTVNLLRNLGFTHICLKQDINGKDRMVKGIWPGQA